MTLTIGQRREIELNQLQHITGKSKYLLSELES